MISRHIRLSKILMAGFVTLTIVVVQPVTSFAYDQDFYNQNDILYYNPDGSGSSICQTNSSVSSVIYSDSDQQTGTGDNVEARKKFVFQSLVGLGFSDAKAAAIFGNLMQESSGLNPKGLEANGSGTPGYTGHGIVQWSWGRWRTDYGTTQDQQRVPNAARTSDLTDFAPYPPITDNLDTRSLLGFASSKNKPWYDLGVQVEFMKSEISPGGNRYNNGTKEFIASTSTDIANLTQFWGRVYEGPSEDKANWPARIQYAREALNKYGGIGGIDATDTGTCSTDTASSVSGAISGDCGKFAEYSLNVPRDAYGKSVCYYNQANSALNSLNSFYKQNGNTWQTCGCGPTTSLSIISGFQGIPVDNPAAVLQAIANRGGVVGGCSGNVSGIKSYFQNNGYSVVNLVDRSNGFGQLEKSDFDMVRSYLKQGYLIFSHTNSHFLGVYAADDNGNFYLFDPGSRANSQPNEAFTESQLNTGSGMAGPASGFGLNEFWAVKKS